jgi:hypothetical protein
MADDVTERPQDNGTAEAAPEPEPAAASGQPAQDELPPGEAVETDGQGEIDGEDQWVFLIDPAWQAVGEGDEPPPGAVVGGWFVEADGTTGYFLPNPEYEPSDPGLPTDPVDAVLQLVVHGEADGDELLEATREVIFGVAVDDEGVAVVAPAPDDVPSVLATTAPRHRERVDAPGWVEVTVEELAAALPEEGVDVLLNPGASASMRVIADVLKEFVAKGNDTVDTVDTVAEEPADVVEEPVGEESSAARVPTTSAVPVVSKGAPAAGAPREASEAKDVAAEATVAANR